MCRWAAVLSPGRHGVSNSRKRLGRLYRIRQVEEDQARLELQSSVAALRRTQARIGEALTAEREARSRRNAALCQPEAAPYGAPYGPSYEWIGAESEAQIQRVLAVRTARAIPKLERDSQTRRDAYFDRRRESRKLESLLHKAEEKEQLETERRERSELDDLLQARRYYKWQRSKKEAK